MLQPKKTKYRKAFKGKIHGNAKGGTTLNFGSYGLKAMEPERITARQIEAARRAIRVVSGSASSRTCRFRRSLPKSVRVRARVRSNTGPLA